MKKSHLRKIIQEEISRVLKEEINTEDYLRSLFGLGGYRDTKFEEMEMADEDLYGDEAKMFIPTRELIRQKGELALHIGVGIATFTADGDDIKVKWEELDYSLK